jgi:DNA-directed RNA polymerase subunit RPC12/RpoP
MSYLPLRSFASYIDANLMLQRLQDEGINCYIKDEHTLTIDPLLIPAMGGMKLMVHEAHAQRAQALLQTYDADYLQTIACKRCGQHTLQALLTQNKRGWLATLLGLQATTEKYYRCSHCGLVYITLPDSNYKKQ